MCTMQTALDTNAYWNLDACVVSASGFCHHPAWMLRFVYGFIRHSAYVPVAMTMGSVQLCL